MAGFDEENAGARVGWLRRGSAAVAVRVREVFYGFAADEKVFEFAVDDDVDGLRGDAFVVDGVGAEEGFAVELSLQRIVGDAEHLGQDAGSVAGGVGAGCAGCCAHLGAVGLDVGNEEAVEDIGGGISAEEDGAVIVVGGDYGRVAEFLEAFEIFDGALAEG